VARAQAGVDFEALPPEASAEAPANCNKINIQIKTQHII